MTQKKRSARMQKIVQLAKSEELKVCRQMGRVQKSLDSDIGRLGELESYRRDYEQQYSQPVTISPARWQDYQSFLQRIDQAVDAQKEQILTIKATRDAHRRRWLQKRQKLESLERVVDRYRQAENREAERRGQKVLDELTSGSRNGRARRDSWKP